MKMFGYNPKYSIVRLDRNRHGGGVALYTCNSILYVLLSGHAGMEYIVLSLSINNFKFCLRVFYRPLFSSPAISDTLCDTLLFQFDDQSHFQNLLILVTLTFLSFFNFYIYSCL